MQSNFHSKLYIWYILFWLFVATENAKLKNLKILLRCLERAGSEYRIKSAEPQKMEKDETTIFLETPEVRERDPPEIREGDPLRLG